MNVEILLTKNASQWLGVENMFNKYTVGSIVFNPTVC
jgi:hypothetical protein